MDNKERIREYFNGLEGTVEYKTNKYTGYKINSKMYAEVHFKKEFTRILVNKKYISNELIDKLNINIEPESYSWTLNAEIKINYNENLNPYIEAIKNAYEGTKKDYEKKIDESIKRAIQDMGSYVLDDMQRKDFASDKLIKKWNEFKAFSISNNDLDELKSDIDSLDKFRSQEILDSYKDKKVKYDFLNLINEVVSYVDINAFNKNIYNEYEDKRTLALTFVRQNDWVKNLISYKKYNDLNKLTEVVRNVIMYINSPIDKLTGFKNYKLWQFIKLLDPNSEVEYNYPALCKKIYKELEKYNIEVENEENRGRIYGKIIFNSNLVKLWDIETTYLKLQPYKTKNLSKEEVDKYLSENIMVASDKKLERNTKYNIFYVVNEENNTMYLATFTSIATKDANNIYYRKFKKLSSQIDTMNSTPSNKFWGSKRSSKSVIVANEKHEFEDCILNKIFDLDVDELLSKIDKMEIENISTNLIKPNLDIVEIVDNYEQNIENEDESFIFEKEIETSLNMILYGPPGTGKTYNTINYAVSIVEKKEIDEVVEEAKKDREAVFKRYKKYLAEKKIVFTTFHQNYSYEEFIQGIRANTNNTDQLSFVKQDGIFKDLVERAKNDLDNYYVIIIDEINRGNISSIFGELITLIEDDKRLNQLNETMVTLPSKEVFGVPGNLFILGTMNTADKSIALIDIALRRRFDFIPMYTDYNVIPEFEHILKPINKAIYDKKRSADYLIGHAFFVGKSIDDLESIINKKILPLLEEYFYCNEKDIIDVLQEGGVRVKQCFNTFKLYYDGIED